MATPTSVASSASRETVQRIHRITRENRSLWYQLTVLQQPERARACGSGMKANSDRRPVDPPPVVELRIIEGPSVEEGKDITFDYNANFFLYASLEQARAMAHGRVQGGAANNPPILTGVPASGMAYLDRPTEAGYFIFPDLSVRHEGYFRLSFSLYELTKEEKDFDLDPSEYDLPPGVDWRMEIKTQPFNVFSAKKFPGLMESTSLSKTVADQGCRVRIRRDVRMRKRDTKAGTGYERRGDDDFARRRTVTPAPAEDARLRDRSVSHSGDPRMPYASDPPRRPSVPEGFHAQPPHPPPPHSSYDHAQASPARPSHLSFGEHGVPQYAAPRQYGPHQSGMAGPYHSAPSPLPYGKNDAPYAQYGVRGAPQPLSSPALPAKPDAYEMRMSAPHMPAMPASPSVYSAAGSTSRRQSQISYPPTPLTAQPSPRHIQPATHSHAHPHHAHSHPHPHAHHAHQDTQNQHSLAPLRIASLVSPSPPIEAQTEPTPAPPMLPTGAKRKHDFVFSQSAKPLHNGQRQLDPHFGHGYRGVTPEPDQGMYSRADGKIGVVTFNQYQV